ncbi:flagellar biosynthesis protein FlhB [Caldicoprobacter algeriensis]|uniref:flagellar biosynthesis protein FlhB n=1 Tax=Caldicoprobacter algeriensis TaxID=699281 RepID=UPI0020795A53|nr:flagellar biosynthesis protein FlhB [Caldicoprobacter algeriensis]MCM8901201.1 flagellar biosynthesis protein FlhB [Caldicoprobacter algeriensis]
MMRMNLQLFAEERTEKATPKKRREARERGQVFKSVELNSAVTLIVGLLALKFTSSFMMEKLCWAYDRYLQANALFDQLYTYTGIVAMAKEIMYTVALVALPLCGLVMLAGLAINYWQVGFIFTTRPVIPNLSRINPLEGLKRIFSKRTLVELLKSLLKLAIVVLISYQEFMADIKSLAQLAKWDVKRSFIAVADMAFNIGIKMAVVFIILAVFDYFYQWWEYEKSLRMTKQELKDEYKEVEGHPLIRSRIRERQRQIGLRRMMQEIPRADVVITNPVHFAVALRYDPKEHDAPVVVAKGQDYLALKIKEVAKKHGVYIVENKPLAQMLYKSTEIGQAIPPELFRAVAEVLAFVYSMRGKRI